MLFLAEPQYVQDIDGIEISVDAVVRLSTTASSPLSQDAVDFSPHLPDLAWGTGTVFVREVSNLGYQPLMDVSEDMPTHQWWAIEDEEAQWLIGQCETLSSNGPEHDTRESVLEAIPGVVYVMRSPAMEKDIFKIGRTSGSAEKRARELSAATGVAAEFLVIEEWETPDCRAVEKAVHRALRPYRLSGRREFFLVSYKIIRQAIDDVVRGVNAQHNAFIFSP